MKDDKYDMINCKVTLKIILGLIILLIVFLIIQNMQLIHLPEGDLSDYLPISMNDEFMLSFGWNNQLERNDFSRLELLVIYNALKSFIPYENLPPWMENRGTIIYGPQPTTLFVTNELYSIEIRLHSNFEFGDFAYVIINTEESQWFTMGEDAFNNLRKML